MKNKKIIYSIPILILIHIVIGMIIFLMPFLAKIYTLLIIAVGIVYIIRKKNNNDEALIASAYVVSAEVLLRMTEGNFLNELAKYAVMLFLLIGMIYKGFSKNSTPIFVYLFLLMPSVFLATSTLDLSTNVRKAITFNMIGPVCLAISAIYSYQREVSQQRLGHLLQTMAYPIVATLTYMFLYAPNVRDVVTGTSSNFQTSGGFGPNQVSTILGFGIFLFFTKILFHSKNKLLLVINVILFLVVTFRGIVTFSRGGIITGVLMVFILLIKLFFVAKNRGKQKLMGIFTVLICSLLCIWLYSSYQTGGMIENRYANEGPTGLKKEDRLGGREKIAKTELQMFLDNPIFGIGVGKNKEYREELTGEVAASHNEITRMLAEHGMFGIIALLILLSTPVILSLDNKQHLYMFSFVIFWLLTINHAAMRLAAPAFIYALSLLKIHSFEKPTLHRE